MFSFGGELLETIVQRTRANVSKINQYRINTNKKYHRREDVITIEPDNSCPRGKGGQNGGSGVSSNEESRIEANRCACNLDEATRYNDVSVAQKTELFSHSLREWLDKFSIHFPAFSNDPSRNY